MDLQNPQVRLEIHMLGRFRIYLDGKNLPESEIKGRKARTLIKLIAHQRHFQMVRDHAVDLLWPELTPTAAASQLYKAIHHIRKAFSSHVKEAADWIQISDDLIRLIPPGGVKTDVSSFEQAARKGLRDDKIPDLETAVSIYTGDFLPMDRYAEWGALPREHYRQLYLDVLTTLARQYESQNALSDAAEMLRLALEKEPALETAHRGLMRIFARQGQSTRAYRQYDLCRKVLGEELGVYPSPKTKAVLDDVREGQFEKKEGNPTQTLITGTPDPLIGRSRECTIIESFLDKLSAGKGNSLIICGEAGIGKSRLIRELIGRSRQKGLSFFTGFTEEGDETRTYGPFIELFHDIFHKYPHLKDILPYELACLVPGFSGDGVRSPHADKLAAKNYLFAEVYRFFSKLSEEGPAVIVLEDLHSADKVSRELFSYLAKHNQKMPLLFVASVRKEPGESVTETIPGLSESRTTILELGPLSFEEYLGLLHQHSESSDLPSEITQKIYRLSEGNPLFTLELLKLHNKEAQHVDFETRGDQSLSDTVEIPVSLRQLVQKKVEKLSPPAHHLLYIAAVIGRRVPYELMASVWSGRQISEETVLFDALEETIRARLLEEQGLDYSFRHAMVREVVYASISRARRQVLHRLVANQLIENSEEKKEPIEKIAYHFLQAGEIQSAVQYLIRSGERAENVYAHEDAIQRYREANEILDVEQGEEVIRQKYELLERIGDVYRASGQLEKSYDVYKQATQLVEQTSAAESDQVELYRKMAVVAILKTEMDRSEKYLAKAFELVGEDVREQARLQITKALHLWHLNQLEEAYEIAKEALSHAQEVDAVAEASQACEILAMTCLPLGRWEEGLKYEHQRQLYGWSPDVVVATDAHLCLWEYHVSGDQPLQQAHAFMEKVARQASDMGDMRCVAVCHYALGTMYLWRGQRRRAVDELSSSLKLHQRVGSPAGMAYSLARKSVLHTMMGATDLGWQAFTEGLAHAQQSAVRDHCLQRLYGVGIWNRIEANDMAAAQQLVEESEHLLEETGACAACALELYPWLAYFYLCTGNISKAMKCREEVSALADMTGNPIGQAIAAMIESSLSVVEKDDQKTERFSRQSFEILKDAVTETSYSPVSYFMNKMIEQQEELRANIGA